MAVAGKSKASTKSNKNSNKGKGKATSPPPTASLVQPEQPEEQAEEEDNDLLDLAESITARAHLLAPGFTDLQLAQQANKVVKASFDRALASETISFPHLQSLLASLNPSSDPSTRSSSRSAEEETPSNVKLQHTPLEELTTEGMDPEMVWEQMEMRSSVVVELLDEMFGGGEEEEEASEGEMEGEDDDEGEGEEDEWQGMMGAGSDEEESDDGDEEEESEGEEVPFEESEPTFTKLGGRAPGEPSSDAEEEDPQADETKDLSISSFDKPGSGASRSRRAPGPASAVDDTFFSLHDFHQQTDEGEFEMAKALRGEVDEEDELANGEGEDELDLFAPVNLGMDEDGEEELDQAGLMYADFFEPPPRPIGKPKDAKGKGKKGSKPRVPSAEESTEPPTPVKKAEVDATAPTPRSVRFNDAVKVKLIAPRGSEFDKLVAQHEWDKADQIYREKEARAQVEGGAEVEDEEEGEEDVEMLDGEGEEGSEEGSEEEEEEGEGDAEEDDEEEGEFESDDDEGQETIERLKSSLFDEEEEEDPEASPAAQLSRHERRLLALSSQIAALEAENVGVKNWATKGEAKAKDRPTNSLLDEDLEYERTGKVVPVVTEEMTKTIEDLIKKRILDNQFDDVIRQRAVDPNAFLPSRFMELQDSKSNKSLAEIYEEDYQTAQAKEEGRTVVHEMDKELEDKHAEIEELFEELSGKLDALSNARFTPKAPKATISTISNLPTITLESALPTATSAGTMLAPEEVYVPDPAAEDRSDFTPAQKKQARQKRRKQRALMAKSAETFVKGVKGEKERATKELIGTKGVTVIGKGGKLVQGGKGVKRKRGEGEVVSSGVGLKL